MSRITTPDDHRLLRTGIKIREVTPAPIAGLAEKLRRDIILMVTHLISINREVMYVVLSFNSVSIASSGA